MTLNSENFDLSGSLQTRNKSHQIGVKYGCVNNLLYQSSCPSLSSSSLTNTRSKDICENGGRCVDKWPRTECDCTFTDGNGVRCQQSVKSIEFDGSRFIRVDFNEELLTEAESLVIRFKTGVSNGFLLSTIPSEFAYSNSSIVQLYISHNLPTFQLQHGEKKMTFKLSTNVSDNKWHTLKIDRIYKSLSLNLDGNILQQAIRSNESLLQWKHLTIGANMFWSENWYSQAFSPKFWHVKTKSKSLTKDHQYDDISNNFVGEINKLQFNGVDMLQMIRDAYISDSNNVQLQNIRVESNVIPETTREQQPIYPFYLESSDSYLKLSEVYLYDKFQLKFWIKTYQTNGVLFLVYGKSEDFLLLEMVSSQLRLVFNMGAKIQEVKTSPKLSNGKWHSLEVCRTDLQTNKILLKIDEKLSSEISVSSPRQSRNFDFNYSASIGGLSRHDSSKWQEIINSHFGFQGCIGGFQLNFKEPISILQDKNVHIPTRYRDRIKNGCTTNSLDKSKSLCRSDICLNGGICYNFWNKPLCDCSYTTFQGLRCSTLSPGVEFKRKIGEFSNLIIRYSDRARNTSRDDLSFGIQTIKKTGTIVYVESSDGIKGDFLHLYIDNGRLYLQFDMGAGIRSLTDHSFDIADGYYHRIRIRREEASAWMQIDNSRSQLDQSDNSNGRHFNQQSSIWLGHYSKDTFQATNQFLGIISGLTFNDVQLSDLIIQNNLSQYYKHITIISSGDISTNFSTDIKFAPNSGLRINEGEMKQILRVTENNKDESLDCSNGICKVKDNIKRVHPRPSTKIPVHLLISTVSGPLFHRVRTLIIVAVACSFVVVLFVICVVCRCFCRTRSGSSLAHGLTDRGSYNLTKADNVFSELNEQEDAKSDGYLINNGNINVYSNKVTDLISISPSIADGNISKPNISPSPPPNNISHTPLMITQNDQVQDDPLISLNPIIQNLTTFIQSDYLLSQTIQTLPNNNINNSQNFPISNNTTNNTTDNNTNSSTTKRKKEVKEWYV